MKYLMQFSKLSDILDTNLDYDLIGEFNMLNFNNPTELKLYIGLNKTNAELLQKGQLTDLLTAFEYSDIASSIKQSEVVVEVSYDTHGLFDTLHPNAYKIMEEHIDKKLKSKNPKITKKDITDTIIINDILSDSKYTGIRAVRYEKTDKLYPNTNLVYGRAMVVYLINPKFVKVLSMKSIHK